MLYEKDLHLHNINGSSHLQPKQPEWVDTAFVTKTSHVDKNWEVEEKLSKT